MAKKRRVREPEPERHYVLCLDESDIRHLRRLLGRDAGYWRGRMPMYERRAVELDAVIERQMDEQEEKEESGPAPADGTA